MQDRLPVWLRKPHSVPKNLSFTEGSIREHGLHTVCVEARCPNRSECFGKRHATFLILGNGCTRSCKFCNIEHNSPKQVDLNEPDNVAKAAKALKLEYVVLTSVTRDDLEDGGSGQYVLTMKSIRKAIKDIRIEVLIPDFKGNRDAIQDVLDMKPVILNHNIEMVKELYPFWRFESDYRLSINLLKTVREETGILTKSGFMLGLGEGMDEVRHLIDDLSSIGVSILTIGQYIAPSKHHPKVAKYYHPDEFDEIREIAIKGGIPHVLSAPFVRSSYRAYETYLLARDGD
jgi:lipoyl synthase